MSFGQDFLKGFFGGPGLKDYAHASKTFLSNGYQNAPRQKFLFHVYLTVNLAVPAIRQVFTNNDVQTIGILAKSVQLPSYTMGVDTMNQYNRKRLVQTKIDYNPVQIEFHDDGGDLVRNMWYNYYAYYYKDPSQKYDNVPNTNGTNGLLAGATNGFSYNNRDIYDNSRTVNDWGYIGETMFGTAEGGLSKAPFFRDIRVYGFNQHKWVEYVLINPLITDWQHDTYDYGQSSGIMNNRMTVRYETVKYYAGAIGQSRPDTNVVGFADPAYYDTVPSALARPGSTATVLGQGGLLDAGIGIYEDLQSGGVAGIVGAVQKAGTAYNTWKNTNVAASLKEEATSVVKGTLQQSAPGAIRAAIGTTASGTRPATRGQLDGIFFPTPPKP